MARRTAMALCTTSRPKTRTVPRSGRSNVTRTRMVVVLPAPLGPSSPKTSPEPTTNSTPSSACTDPNRWLSSRHSTAGVGTVSANGRLATSLTGTARSPAGPEPRPGGGDGSPPGPGPAPVAPTPVLLGQGRQGRGHQRLAGVVPALDALLRGRGQAEPGHPSIPVVAAPFEEAGRLELADQRAHRVGRDAQGIGRLLDAEPGSGTEQADDLQLGLGQRGGAPLGPQPVSDQTANPMHDLGQIPCNARRR